MRIRVFEAFAGYGSQMMALRRVARRHAGGADFQLVGWSEIDNDAIAAHNAVFPEYAECNHGDTFPYRIRYLVPRECFRLMDVADEDYDKIKNYIKGHQKNGKPMYISESQQYKLAGNSIVVACMEHIFEQLFFPSGRVTEPRQLDIFDII